MTFLRSYRLILLFLLAMPAIASAFYDPTVGRFISRDPIGDGAFALQHISGKTETEIEGLYEESLLPPYLFVRNSPINFIDRLGLEKISFDFETEIKRGSLFPPIPSGVKSVHYFIVDTDTLNVIGEIKQAGPTFKVKGGFIATKDVSRDTQNPCAIRVKVTGKAWTFFKGWPLSPATEDIDYAFDILVDPSKKTGSLLGFHDGYPSYAVRVSGALIYNFDETNIKALEAPLDISVIKSFGY